MLSYPIAVACCGGSVHQDSDEDASTVLHTPIWTWVEWSNFRKHGKVPYWRVQHVGYRGASNQ